MGGEHYLILGGARSGKSNLAEKIALSLGQNPAYIATAQPHDYEMRARIGMHQKMRSRNFTTIEEPLALAKTLLEAAENHDVIMVDCLTLWLSNLSFAKSVNIQESFDQLIGILKTLNTCQVVFVSNELGLGIVPDNELVRKFRDDAGRLHQLLGAYCDHVIMVMAGLPLAFKGQVPMLE